MKKGGFFLRGDYDADYPVVTISLQRLYNTQYEINR